MILYLCVCSALFKFLDMITILQPVHAGISCFVPYRRTEVPEEAINSYSIIWKRAVTWSRHRVRKYMRYLTLYITPCSGAEIEGKNKLDGDKVKRGEAHVMLATRVRTFTA